ncbi:MAG: hypothetical protein U0169_05200 [Polyangiaceae bacterium]
MRDTPNARRAIVLLALVPTFASAPSTARADGTCPVLDASTFELPPLDTSAIDAPVPPIVDPTDKVMASFHEKLAALVRGRRKEPIRIALYGDSNMTQDGISGGVRRTLQAKYGDAGHGFVALGRAWPWYLHMDVLHDAEHGRWKAYSTSVQPAPDAYYGFANMAFETKKKGARTWVSTEDGAPVGAKVSRFDTYFLKGPNRGSFDVRIDGRPVRTVSTRATANEAGFEAFDVPDGAHKFELFAGGDESIRVFGVTLERGTPGVVVDSLGTGALNYEQMTRVEAKTRRAMLERRKYDLVFFHIGSNIFAPGEAVSTSWIKKVVDAHREARPGLPVVILSPSDIVSDKTSKKSDPRIKALVGELRRGAEATGSAYWDFWSAMGGEQSMLALRKKGLASTDLIHFVRKSGIMMGDRIAHALVADLARYVAAHPRAGCEAGVD